MKRLVCPFCGGDLKWVIKDRQIEFESWEVGLMCHEEKCGQFYTYVWCGAESIEQAKKMLRKSMMRIQEANHACE